MKIGTMKDMKKSRGTSMSTSHRSASDCGSRKDIGRAGLFAMVAPFTVG
jgi:hypothetical protein